MLMEQGALIMGIVLGHLDTLSNIRANHVRHHVCPQRSTKQECI